MITEIASSTLAAIAYRLATEPAFAQQIRTLIETRMFNGQVITEAEIAALKSLLDLGITPVGVDGALGALYTWIG